MLMPDTDPFFVVEPLRNLPFRAMIFALDYRRPDEWLPAVPAALQQAGVSGRVVLDLLACNGNTLKRYFSAEVNPLTGRLQGIHREYGVELTAVSARLLLENLSLLNLSLLSEEEQLAARSGTPLPRSPINSVRPE
jgi:hypothetical protein